VGDSPCEFDSRLRHHNLLIIKMPAPKGRHFFIVPGSPLLLRVAGYRVISRGLKLLETRAMAMEGLSLALRFPYGHYLSNLYR